MRTCRAFTLVELVVVILILGILAGVAAPKLLDTSGFATENGVRQTLAVVRDAIELYAASHDGTLPGQSDNLPGDLADYMRGAFPTSPVGAQDNSVGYTSLIDINGDAAPSTSWKYSITSGEFICNSKLPRPSDPVSTYDEL